MPSFRRLSQHKSAEVVPPRHRKQTLSGFRGTEWLTSVGCIGKDTMVGRVGINFIVLLSLVAFGEVPSPASTR